MPNVPEVNVEQIVADFSRQMSERSRLISASARTEEDIRHEFNKLIEEFCTLCGIEARGLHEYAIAGGQLDSKYGCILIEYKAAGRIGATAESAGTVAVVAQLEQRFAGFHTKERISPDRMLGVGTDGRRIVYVRYRGGKPEVDGPADVTPYSLVRLLRALISVGARGMSFTPANLAQHFGADSPQAREEIGKLYSALVESGHPKVQTLFAQWKILFGEVCGYDVEGRNEKIRKLGHHYGIKDARSAETLFAVHTYYAIFMKLLAAEIVSLVSPLGKSVLQKCMRASTAGGLRRELDALEEGGIWRQIGITNFLEGDLFSWYLDAWDDRLAAVLSGMLQRLEAYDPRTLSVEPNESRDLLKRLYQQLFPKSVRHDLGEYYTPDWLADVTIDEVGYDGSPDKRVLDPACGSGTFLVLVINRIKAWFAEHRFECGFGESVLLDKILTNVIGFDLNPLAVMAARTNYLLAIRDLLVHAGPIEIPVYLCDSVVLPSRAGSLFRTDEEAPPVRTAEGFFQVPGPIVSDRGTLARYAEILEQAVAQDHKAEELLARLGDQDLLKGDRQTHVNLWMKLRDLQAKDKNGIWIRIIKNNFAPLFVGKVDFVIGNPPWINWESLPTEYRNDIKPLWRDYGLFSLSGSAGRMGGGKKDMSMLFVYACADHYLEFGGKLAFVITQTVFKTKGAGDGFRRFKFTTRQRAVLKPLVVHDLSRMQVFEGATNRTAVFVCQKQQRDFKYPVHYGLWTGPSRIDPDSTGDDVESVVTRHDIVAVPVDVHKSASPWLTAPEAIIPALRKVTGQSAYKAHEGANTGGLNGCYWVQVLRSLPGGNLLIRNLHDVGKIKVEPCEHVLEPDLVYPLLRGRDVKQWLTRPSAHIILAQDPEAGKGIAEPIMKRDYPLTYDYLKKFEGKEKPERGTLRGRALFKKYFKPTDPFYSMYGIGTYTLSKWKVVWCEQAADLTLAVVGGQHGMEVIPDHKLMFVVFKTASEAYFVAAVLSSAAVRTLVRSYSSPVSTSTHVADTVQIPKYDPKVPMHKSLVSLCKQGHTLSATADQQELASLRARIDRLAGKLWGVKASEMVQIADFLSILEGDGGRDDIGEEDISEDGE